MQRLLNVYKEEKRQFSAEQANLFDKGRALYISCVNTDF